MSYCCKYMKDLDKKEIIDYCPPNLTSLDVDGSCYPIYFCPFCGKEIEGSKKFVKKLKSQMKGIKEGKIKTYSIGELIKKMRKTKQGSKIIRRKNSASIIRREGRNTKLKRNNTHTLDRKGLNGYSGKARDEKDGGSPISTSSAPEPIRKVGAKGK